MTKATRLTKLEAADFIDRSFKPMPQIYGEALLNAARKDSRIVCLTADLAGPTETGLFRDALPDRFYQVGIAEANMVGLAGGMARSGEIPFAHSFCVFITKRAYDQISMQAAYPNLPVKLVGFLPGVSTLLGVSHQAIEDVAIMRAMPNMMILEPSGPEYFASAVQAALDYDGPVYLRMKRPETPPEDKIEPRELTVGKGMVRRDGSDLTIFTAGMSVAEALAAAEVLQSEGLSPCVVDMASIKPLDADIVVRQARETGAIVVAENHSVIGGLGSAIAEVLCDAGIGLPFRRVGLQDCFAEGATTPYLFAKYGIDSTAIAQAARDVHAKKVAD